LIDFRISHSEIERRRREKMNRYIDEIAQLLPIDPVKKLDKLTVLRVAVDTVKHLKGRRKKFFI
jgi:aryl hydrocarbon receptor nuclear translocator-like protein 1